MLTASLLLLPALLLLPVAGVAGGAPSLEFHHRFSARVRPWADSRGHELPGGWPAPGGAAYVAALAGHDRHRALSAAGEGGRPPLTFSEGNATLKVSNLGFLHYALVTVGTPGHTFMVALDTGSDLFWLPCQCDGCTPPPSSAASAPEVKCTVINCLRDCLAEDPPRLDNYLKRAFKKVKATGGFQAVMEAVDGVKDCVHILLVWHIATCYCEIDLAEKRKVSASMYWSGQDFDRRKPSEEGVPGNSLMARSVLLKVREEKSRLFNRKFDSCAPCYRSTQMLGRFKKYASEEIELYKKKEDGEKQDEENQDGKKEENLDDTILKKGADLGKKLIEAFSGDKPEDLWRFLSEFWAGFVIHLAASTRASQHKIYLSSGGELMTHLWALLTHAGILGEVQHGDQDFDTALTQDDVYDRTVQS